MGLYLVVRQNALRIKHLEPGIAVLIYPLILELLYVSQLPDITKMSFVSSQGPRPNKMSDLYIWQISKLRDERSNHQWLPFSSGDNPPLVC